MSEFPGTANSAHRLWFLFRIGFALLAVWVAVAEPWDANSDGRISPHEVLLFPVRFLAFPLHILLSLTPSPVLHALGLPDAYWPSSAVLAVVISLPSISKAGARILCRSSAVTARVSSSGA
jgi:hypothetical protein